MVDSVPISALQHYAYCPRQCALIHVERVFHDNMYTNRGHREHQKVHEPDSENVDGVRIERALPLSAPCLGVHGVADVVEFHEDGRIEPVEHKVGRRAPRTADNVQVAAQAMTLEEMFDVDVPRAWVFHHASRRRRLVEIDQPLRELTYRTVRDVRWLMRFNHVPKPVNDSRCPRCSLVDVCLPGVTSLKECLHTPDATFSTLER